MILQRLAEHYDRLEAAGSVHLAQPGASQQRISFCIVLEPDGQFNSFEDMRRQEGKTLQPRTMIVPGQSKPPGQGLNPCFLWDNAEYLLGWTEDPTRLERAARAFEASRAMHLALESSIATPEYTAVCGFLRNWQQQASADLRERLKEVATNFGVFRVAGQQRYVHEVVTVPAAAKLAEGEAVSSMCLVTGSIGPSARLHEPKIKGVADAQTGGALLVSFNATAFESYGKEQSRNAPVSTVAVFKYANALNHLLSLRERRIALGDATVVFWADHFEPLLEDCFSMLFGGTPAPAGEDTSPKEDQTRVDEARLLLTQLRDGTCNTWTKPDGQSTKFYILGLSPNASRLSVRLWFEATAPELERRLGEHLRDLALKSNFDERPLSIRMLANATGRYQANGKTKFDTKGTSPQLAGELARSVLTGAAYPQSFLATIVRRIRSDSYVGYERVSAIKACLVRNAGLRSAFQQPFKELPVELDSQRDSVAYRCGRLFALLEKAQTDSVDGELNSTIKDKYFAAASATPALIFPRLFRLNNHHLAKLEVPGKVFYGKLFASAMEAPFAFPKSLNLAGQGEFIVGYFQQQQALYKKKIKPFEETA